MITLYCNSSMNHHGQHIHHGRDSVTIESTGRVVYRINTIPEWHKFNIRETQFIILLITFTFFNSIFIKAKAKRFKQTCIKYETVYTAIREVLTDVIVRYVTSV